MELRKLTQVERRYQKSIHLERDAASSDALAGYVVTPLVRRVLRPLLLGLQANRGQRAWSLTGPYGTGKSALALLWSNLVGPTHEPRTKKARRLLSAADRELANEFYGRKGPATPEGLVTVLATGERAPLEEVILRALYSSLSVFWSGRGAKPAVLRSVGAALKRSEQGKRVGTRKTVCLIEEAAAKICDSSNAGSGLVLVLDEAGKCLEFAAHEPTRGDVQLLQELAEAANRSADTPFLFLTILHQSIERYAGRLVAAQRNEWAKVQGRFEDIAFQEDSDQLLRLLAAALRHPKPLPKPAQREFERLVEQVAAQASAGDPDRSKDLASQLAGLFPLHPTCALILGPLFRTRLAQNERSLFGFLASGEPLGFQAHLGRKLTPKVADCLYTIGDLYDYVVSALGTQLYGQDGRAWAEIDTALRRLPKDANATDVRLLKVIGILTIIGDHANLRASSEVLNLALLNGGTARGKITAALERLCSSSAIVFRKYRNAYQIWEGSDLDVEGLIQSAFQQTDTRSGLAKRLTAIAPPRPMVARRHLFQTGTLRYFDVRYVEADAIEGEMEQPASAEADGTLLIALPRSVGDLDSLRDFVSQQMFWFAHLGEVSKPVVVGVPRNANHLSNLAAELAALEWVHSNTPELARDPVARRELTARLQEAERLVREELGRLIDGSSRNSCDWYHRAERLQIVSAPDLGRCLSDICDRTYDKAPVILNELLNRRQLSSAAAAARRNLIEAMIEHNQEKRLAIDGYPPELSMYRSLLERHRLHRKTREGWGISKPLARKPGSLSPAWKAIEQFLATSENQRRSLADLYEVLRQPPFGIKDGVLPVIVSAALLYLDSEVALYEAGAFVPGLTTPVAERMMRWPDKFELQRFKIAGVRAKVFQRFGRALLSGADADKPTLLAIVRSLVQFIADLPSYARLTKSISRAAQEVRGVLLRAKEPGPLLFRDLPEACECKPFTASGSLKSTEVERFFATLRAALGELQTAYPNLLSELEQLLATTFELPTARATLRQELATRAGQLTELAAEPDVRAFLIRAADAALPYDEWLLSVATYLGRKPPPKWNDSDLETMQLTVARIGRKVRALESLALQLGKRRGSDTVVRLSITEPMSPELERIVAIREDERGEIQTLSDALASAVNNFRQLGLSTDGALAALLQTAQRVLTEDEQEPVESELHG